MKVVKPMKLATLHRPIEIGRRFYLSVASMVFCPITSPKALLGEISLWKFLADVLGENPVLDAGLSKPCGEFLVFGNCLPASATTATAVRVKVGGAEKRIAVVGDRFWKDGVPTPPEPFSQMPVDYAHAFGGATYPTNPLGKGAARRDRKAGPDGHTERSLEEGREHPLPNLEDPEQLIDSPRDRPVPRCFGPIDLTWPQRMTKAGTYDDAWLETHFPGPAADIDLTFYNTAPEDQWLEAYFEGDELIEIENMHAEDRVLAGALPPLRPRMFVTHRDDPADAERTTFKELKPRLETLYLFPNADRMVLLFRAMVEVRTDDASDIVHLILAAEDSDSAPRPVSHYQRVLERRLDKDVGALAALDDKPLMPSLDAGWSSIADKTDVDDWVRSEASMFDNMKRGRDAKLAQTRADLEAKGLDPKDYGLDDWPEDEPLPDLDDFDGMIELVQKQRAELAKKEAELEDKKQEMEAAARQKYAESGVDYDAVTDKALQDGAGPPKFSAKQYLESMASMAKIARDGGEPLTDLEAQLADPRYCAQFEQLEVQQVEMYRRSAQYMPDPRMLDSDASGALRVLLTAARDGEESLAGRDFTGADLRGADLSELDLRGAFFENAWLSNARLTGAKLEGAVLAKTDLTDADFSGANLDGANLGGAKLVRTQFAGASMREAILSRASVVGASFERAAMHGAEFLETTFEGADFAGVRADKLLFIQIDLTGLSFAEAELPQCRFLECQARGVDFHGAKLQQVQFVDTPVDGANFRGACMNQGVFTHGTSAVGADFTEAVMHSVNFRGTPLKGAKFGRAQMNEADLSNCDAREAELYRAVATGGLFAKTDLSGAAMMSINLMDALLPSAVLKGTDLRGANLFGTDLSRVEVDGATKLEGALMTRARVDPMHERAPLYSSRSSSKGSPESSSEGSPGSADES